MEPLVNACLPRSPQNLIAAIASVNLTTAVDLQRDYGGNGWTHCNLAVVRILAALGITVPMKLANDLQLWFLGDGSRDGWRKVSLPEAMKAADRGEPVVVSYFNDVGHGHIAVMRPSRGDGVPRIAQAGARNFEDGTLAAGFGKLQNEVLFFTRG